MAQRDSTGECVPASQSSQEQGERYEPPRAFDLGPLVDLTLGGIITGTVTSPKAGS